MSGITRRMSSTCSSSSSSLITHLHLLAAEHVAGPHQQREAELARQGDGLLGVVHRAEPRVGDPEVAQQAAEPLAVLGHVQRLVAGVPITGMP